MVRRYVVVLRRANGRLVKRSRPKRSRYAAKQVQLVWNEKYDLMYYTEIAAEEQEE